MTYQHVYAHVPCAAGEQQLMAWLDQQKNEQGYDLVSVSVVMAKKEEVNHAGLRSGGPVLLGQQQAVPCWFVVLRRLMPGQQNVESRMHDYLTENEL